MRNLALGRPVSFTPATNASYPEKVSNVLRSGDSDWVSGASRLTNGARARTDFNNGHMAWDAGSTDVVLRLDLGAAQEGQHLYVFGNIDTPTNINRPLHALLEQSDDDTNWATVEDIDSLTASGASQVGTWLIDFDISAAGSHRYWRITLERDPTWLFVSQIEFWDGVPDLGLGATVTFSHTPNASYAGRRMDILRTGDTDWNDGVVGHMLSNGHPGLVIFETHSYVAWVSLAGADVVATIDLGSAEAPNLVAIRGYHGDNVISRPLQVKLEHSDDNSNWTTFSDRDGLTDGGAPGACRWAALFDTSAESAHRYWRVTLGTDGNDWLFVSEIQFLPEQRDRQQYRPCTTTGLGGAGYDTKRFDILDGADWTDNVAHHYTDGFFGGGGDIFTAEGYGFALYDGTANDVETAVIDLGAAYEGAELIVHGAHNWGASTGRPKAVQVEHSDDNSNWTSVETISGLTAPGSGVGAPTFLYVCDISGAGAHRYWRVSLTQSAAFIAVSEIQFVQANEGYTNLLVVELEDAVDPGTDEFHFLRARVRAG